MEGSKWYNYHSQMTLWKVAALAQSVQFKCECDSIVKSHSLVNQDGLPSMTAQCAACKTHVLPIGGRCL